MEGELGRIAEMLKEYALILGMKHNPIPGSTLYFHMEKGDFNNLMVEIHRLVLETLTIYGGGNSEHSIRFFSTSDLLRTEISYGGRTLTVRVSK